MVFIKNYIRSVKKKRNSGFSLVELIVAFAILAVVALCISIMMGAGSNMFARVNKNINLSFRTQIPVSQLREYIIDSVGVAQEKDENGNVTTYLTGYDGDVLKIYCITWVDTDNDEINDTVKMKSADVVTEHSVDYSQNNLTWSDEQVFAKKVTDFKLELNNAVTSMKIYFKSTVKSNGKDSSYEKNILVNFRNSVVYADKNKMLDNSDFTGVNDLGRYLAHITAKNERGEL